jgi:hypothetical protein
VTEEETYIIGAYMQDGTRGIILTGIPTYVQAYKACMAVEKAAIDDPRERVKDGGLVIAPSEDLSWQPRYNGDPNFRDLSEHNRVAERALREQERTPEEMGPPLEPPCAKPDSPIFDDVMTFVIGGSWPRPTREEE